MSSGQNIRDDEEVSRAHSLACACDAYDGARVVNVQTDHNVVTLSELLCVHEASLIRGLDSLVLGT